MTDRFEPERFVDAQREVFDVALGEITRGAKRSHWMWFVFPQIAGLGHSAMAQRYAIGSLDEARAYLAHPVLGPRYRECVAALQDLPRTTAKDVFGTIDALKLRSSLTLFAEASDAPLFDAAVDRWFGGEKDEATLRIIDSLETRPAWRIEVPSKGYAQACTLIVHRLMARPTATALTEERW